MVLNGHESAERRRRQQRLDRSQPAAQLANQRPATLEVVGFPSKGRSEQQCTVDYGEHSDPRWAFSCKVSSLFCAVNVQSLVGASTGGSNKSRKCVETTCSRAVWVCCNDVAADTRSSSHHHLRFICIMHKLMYVAGNLSLRMRVQSQSQRALCSSTSCCSAAKIWITHRLAIG